MSAFLSFSVSTIIVGLSNSNFLWWSVCLPGATKPILTASNYILLILLGLICVKQTGKLQRQALMGQSIKKACDCVCRFHSISAAHTEAYLACFFLLSCVELLNCSVNNYCLDPVGARYCPEGHKKYKDD